MLKSTLARLARACGCVLRDPSLWLFAIGLLVVAFLLGTLLVFAIEGHDTYLRLRPLICEQGISNRRFFIVAVAAPLWVVFMLATLGELWGQIELRRGGQATHWFHFLLFLALASGLGALVVFGLGC